MNNYSTPVHKMNEQTNINDGANNHQDNVPPFTQLTSCESQINFIQQRHKRKFNDDNDDVESIDSQKYSVSSQVVIDESPDDVQSIIDLNVSKNCNQTIKKTKIEPLPIKPLCPSTRKLKRGDSLLKEFKRTKRTPSLKQIQETRRGKAITRNDLSARFSFESETTPKLDRIEEIRRKVIHLTYTCSGNVSLADKLNLLNGSFTTGESDEPEDSDDFVIDGDESKSSSDSDLDVQDDDGQVDEVVSSEIQEIEENYERKESDNDKYDIKPFLTPTKSSQRNKKFLETVENVTNETYIITPVQSPTKTKPNQLKRQPSNGDTLRKITTNPTESPVNTLKRSLSEPIKGILHNTYPIKVSEKRKPTDLQQRLANIIREQRSQLKIWQHEKFLETTTSYNFAKPSPFEEQPMLQLQILRDIVQWSCRILSCRVVEVKGDSFVSSEVVVVLGRNVDWKLDSLFELYPPYFVEWCHEKTVILNAMRFVNLGGDGVEVGVSWSSTCT